MRLDAAQLEQDLAFVQARPLDFGDPGIPGSPTQADLLQARKTVGEIGFQANFDLAYSPERRNDLPNRQTPVRV